MSNTVSTLVIIPSYEPPQSFVDYVRDLMANDGCEVLVVNDGSGERYAPVYAALTDLPGCTVIGYDINRGKGGALKYAFAYCQAHYSDAVTFATADCDGQHRTHDVLHVADTARQHPGKLVLGVRDFNAPNVPARSRSGNLQTRRIFRFLYRLNLSDTQTGLRAFSYSMLPSLLAIHGDRFEYEMNMLIVLHKQGVELLESPIETVYEAKPDDVERISHFRTFRDGVRVIGTLFKNLGWYMISSVVSALLDVLAFYFLIRFLFVDGATGLTPALNNLCATVAARIFSSIFNFIFNFKLVFNGKSRRAVFRYYLLWLAQLSASYGIVCLWSLLIPDIAILLTLLKGASDLCLAILSYQIQSRWVFAEHRQRDRLHFYGPFFRLCRRGYSLFNRRYRSFVVPDEQTPAIYLCRHLNMHGPFKVAQSLTFDTHLMILHCFTNFKECYRQYADYTFTARTGKRGIRATIGRIKAFFGALFVPLIVRSSRPVPVYRGGADTMVTMRAAMRFLDQGENVTLFPDVDYTADASTAGRIYEGFFWLEKLYYRKHKTHLPFVTLTVDDEKREIRESGRVSFRDGIPFEEELPRVSAEVTALLMTGADR